MVDPILFPFLPIQTQITVVSAIVAQHFFFSFVDEQILSLRKQMIYMIRAYKAEYSKERLLFQI